MGRVTGVVWAHEGPVMALVVGNDVGPASVRAGVGQGAVQQRAGEEQRVSCLHLHVQVFVALLGLWMIDCMTNWLDDCLVE